MLLHGECLRPVSMFPVASVDLERWARLVARMNLSIVFAFLGLIAGIIVIATLIGIIKAWLKGLELRAWRKVAKDQKLRPDGIPYPPSGRGMCDTCEKAYDKVYYLPDGRRICPGCYVLTETATGEPRETVVEDKGSANERQTESGQ